MKPITTTIAGITAAVLTLTSCGQQIASDAAGYCEQIDTHLVTWDEAEDFEQRTTLFTWTAELIQHEGIALDDRDELWEWQHDRIEEAGVMAELWQLQKRRRSAETLHHRQDAERDLEYFLRDHELDPDEFGPLDYADQLGSKLREIEASCDIALADTAGRPGTLRNPREFNKQMTFNDPTDWAFQTYSSTTELVTGDQDNYIILAIAANVSVKQFQGELDLNEITFLLIDSSTGDPIPNVTDCTDYYLTVQPGAEPVTQEFCFSYPSYAKPERFTLLAVATPQQTDRTYFYTHD